MSDTPRTDAWLETVLHGDDQHREWLRKAVAPVHALERELNQVKAERDALKQWQVEMVAKAADKSLAGYRELGAKCAALEAERDALRDKVRSLNSLSMSMAARILAVGTDYEDYIRREPVVAVIVDWRMKWDKAMKGE